MSVLTFVTEPSVVVEEVFGVLEGRWGAVGVELRLDLGHDASVAQLLVFWQKRSKLGKLASLVGRRLPIVDVVVEVVLETLKAPRRGAGQVAAVATEAANGSISQGVFVNGRRTLPLPSPARPSSP